MEKEILTHDFIYKGSAGNDYPIRFQTGDSIMINATEMAKPFGKRPVNWLELPSTRLFLTSLQKVRKSDHLIQTVSGRSGGTWMHEDVALEFARWLSPEFAIWCNDRIKELMKYGMTATPDKIEELLSNPDLLIGLATELKEERAKRALAEKHVEKMAPRYNYVQEFFEANGTMSIGEMAKNLGIKPLTMFRMLRDDGYLMIRPSDRNIAKQQYIDAGYFEIKITVKNGNQFRQTRVTPRGHGYFAKKYNLFPSTFENPI